METRYKTFTGLITRLMRSIRRIKTDEMADFQLKGPHVSCLYYLYDEGAMTAAALCEKCGEDKAALSRALETLCEGGYITRGDRRYRSPISLTDSGRAVCEEIARRIDRVVEEAGAENNFIFGATVEELRACTDYDPRKIYESDPHIRRWG